MYNDRPSKTLPCNVMQQTTPPPRKKITKQTKKPQKKQTSNTQNKTKTANTNQTLYAKKVCKNMSHFVVICYKICLLHL